VRAPSGNLVGIAMILADCKSVGDDTVERVTTAPVRAIMQRLAVLMKPGAAHRAGDTHVGGTTTAAISVLERAAESVLAPLPAAAIPPEQVNDILEFELAPEYTPAPPASRLNGSAEIRSSSDMLSLEFVEDAPAAAPRPPRAARPPGVPPVLTEPAPPAVAAVVAAPVSDANLILEVLPFAKLRAGGQTRRFRSWHAPRPARRSAILRHWTR